MTAPNPTLSPEVADALLEKLRLEYLAVGELLNALHPQIDAEIGRITALLRAADSSGSRFVFVSRSDWEALSLPIRVECFRRAQQAICELMADVASPPLEV